MGDSKLNEMPAQVIGNEKMPWTDERVELLKKLWTEGLRATQPRSTEPRAPRKTREPSHPGRPVGSPSMPSTGNTALKTFVRVEPVQRQIALPEPQPLRLVDLPKGGRVTILHLSDKTCKWPIGDPGSEDFCFCGHSPRDKSPYCEYHARAAYQPMQDRRHRKFG